MTTMSNVQAYRTLIPASRWEEFLDIVEEVAVKAIAAGILNDKDGSQAHRDITMFAFEVLKYRGGRA